MYSQPSVRELRSRGVVKLKEPDMYSMWVKTACCNMNSSQIKALAGIIEKYGRGVILFSSRQIPIIPFVRFKDIPLVEEELKGVYLILDRCGPTVRNVNVCYDDKTCPHAVTNSLALGQKLDNFFHMPMAHKVKLGVSGCSRDCVISRVLSDIGFVGVENNGQKGYDVYVGGRLGLNPFLGVKMASCLSESESVKLVQNYFDFMNREGKGEERSADLIKRLGEVRVRTELLKDLTQGSPLQSIVCESAQKESQADKIIVRIRATCGEVSSSQLRAIANIASKYGQGFIHFSVRGAPEIPYVNEKDRAKVKAALKEAGLEYLEDGIDNLQSCFGGYCTEGNANPQPLLRRIESLVKELGINDSNIKISASGCPNSCGLPQINDIGFYGVREPAIEPAACKGCELCVPVCKRKAIFMKDGKAIIDGAKCKHCGLCITVCPFDAIIEKRKGFTVFAGGKEGKDTRLGEVIAEFLSEDETLILAEATLRLLAEQHTGAAEIIDEVGIEQFKATIKLIASNKVDVEVVRNGR